MENLLKELLEKVNSIDGEVDQISTRLDSVEKRLDLVETEIKGLKNDIRTLDNRITQEHEVTSEELKLEVQYVHEETKNIRADINTIEMVTAKNWGDITKLKGVR